LRNCVLKPRPMEGEDVRGQLPLQDVILSPERESAAQTYCA
jgi:hypothetical protein